MPPITAITARIKRAALEAGFDLAGIAPVEDSPELAAYPAWIAAGHAGEMRYLEARDTQGRLKRASIHSFAPWTRSVVVCALNYNTAQPRSTKAREPRRGWISRYAWTQEDYHDVVMRRLRRVETAIHEAGRECETRCYVDTGPVVERVYAKYAGIGWLGKNTCLINPQTGSWLFLGVILTSLELQADLPAPDRCGSCRRCIEACPTEAFPGPYQLDASRCISYLTIEKRGAVPEPLRAGMGNQVFGCDICQDVCPWNRKAPVSATPELQARPELVNPALDWLALMPEDEFRSVFRGSPVKRAKHSGLRRNAVLAMGNSGDEAFIPILERLRSDPDQTLAEAAGWALSRLRRQVASSDTSARETATE